MQSVKLKDGSYIDAESVWDASQNATVSDEIAKKLNCAWKVKGPAAINQSLVVEDVLSANDVWLEIGREGDTNPQRLSIFIVAGTLAASTRSFVTGSSYTDGKYAKEAVVYWDLPTKAFKLTELVYDGKSYADGQIWVYYR